jgi:hypothetical protein
VRKRVDPSSVALLRRVERDPGHIFGGVAAAGRQAAGLMEFDLTAWSTYAFCMNAVEFTTERSGAAVLPIPREIAAQLPKSGKARIIVLTDDTTDEAEWRAGAHEQFLRDDAVEDAVYDSLR